MLVYKAGNRVQRHLNGGFAVAVCGSRNTNGASLRGRLSQGEEGNAQRMSTAIVSPFPGPLYPPTTILPMFDSVQSSYQSKLVSDGQHLIARLFF